MDVYSKERRSEIMSLIGGKDTKPEIRVRRLLHGLGLRFRLHRKDLPGKPDIVLPKYKTVIFVHGCLWHGHDCPRGKRPACNAEFWAKKLDGNLERDRKAQEALRESGWKVLVIWECRMKEMNWPESLLDSIMQKPS